MSGKILFICSEFPPGPGGIGNHGFNLINTLSNKGYNTLTVTNLENATKIEAERFVTKYGLRVKYISRSLWVILFRLWYAVYYSIRFKPDIILFSGKFSLWTAVIVSFFSKALKIAIIHGTEADIKILWQKRLTNYSYHTFNHIVSVSEYTQKFVRPVIPDAKHHIIPNAVDISFLTTFKNSNFIRLKGNPALLTVGNLTKRKGQHNIIIALPTLIQVYPDIHYHCVGLPTLITENKNLAIQLGVENHVTFHGKLDLNNLMGAYKGCDIFAMTSEHLNDGDFEGFGISILEAAFFGKPAIGSKGCGIEDAIDDYVTGVKVDAKSPDEIMEAIKYILKNYSNMSDESILWANRHDWSIIAENYIKLWTK